MLLALVSPNRSPKEKPMSDITRKHANQRMSQLVVHGGIAYLAGQVAGNAKGEDVSAQTRDILESIDRLLAEAGTDKTRLLAAQIWLADMSTFAEMNAVWDAWVAPGEPPVRACVEARLAAPDYTVEIMVTAAV
jgi:enamine deaminase RidA (YjgF/YER057c/UK114 family)